MLRDILNALKEERDPIRRAIQEQYAKDATGVAYAGAALFTRPSLFQCV